ncbi:MAG: N(4)-(beta-N-acetylglucosaminyl)-L-asparaginase [Candidatus Kapaibacterium sp.]
MKRRDFLRTSALAGSIIGTMRGGEAQAQDARARDKEASVSRRDDMMVLSTWSHGIDANDAAWKVLERGGEALDAVEQGVMVSEADPAVTSVGYGGLPDRDGHVTLDACIMDEQSRAGRVACLEHLLHPISVARKVMETTSHVMLVGAGALAFAESNGFKRVNMLTEEARKAWEEWKKMSGYRPRTDRENHDTICMISRDGNGNFSVACTTSGLAWKIHGRVGDIPIIGAGLFVDHEVGAATATGKGEAVIRIAGSAIIVELMRQGKTPQQACEEAVERIVHRQRDYKEFQVGFIAMNSAGQTGAFSIHKGFQYALRTPTLRELRDSGFRMPE